MATIKKFNAIDRIGEIAKGFQQGIGNYAQGVNQQRQMSLQDEALRRQQAMDAMNTEAKITEATGRNAMGSGLGAQILSGGQYSPEQTLGLEMTPKFENEQKRLNRQNGKDEYDAGQRSLPYNERDDYKKTMDAAKIRANATLGNMGAKNELENQQNIKKVQIADFDIADPSIIPSSKDAEEVKSLNASNKSFQEIGARAIEKLKQAKPRDPRYYVSKEWAGLNQDLTKMKLQAKNLEDLGVLNGPDLGLVNETFGSITPAKLAVLGPEEASKLLASAVDTANKVMINAAAARNYKPKGQAGSGSTLPKKGEEKKGYIFLGGDPSKPESWAKANS